MKWKMCIGLLALIIFSNVANAQSCGWTPIPPANSACGTWQMYGGSQKHTGIQRMKANMSSGRFVKWSYTTGNWVWSSPAIGDINNDGIPDVVVGSWDKKIYALRGDNGSLLWSYTTGDAVLSSPAIGDINNDGIPDVVVGSDDYKIYALRGDNGSLLWSYTTGNYFRSSPAIGDINNDEIPDVVVGSWDSKIYALRGDNGSLLWSVSLPSQYWPDGIKLADIDPSPGLEVIASTGHDRVYVISSNGAVLWSMAPVGQMRNSSVGDVDGDNCVEIVVTGEGTPMVAVIDAPGSNCSAEIRETNKINYQIEKNGIKLNRAVNYELFSANGRLIKKGYGDFINIKNKGIYFLKAESEVLKFVVK